MSSFSPVTHVIFDLDGLLMDTEELYSRAYQAALDPFGKTYTFEFKVKLMGTNEKDCARTVVDGYGLPITPEEFLTRLEAEQDKILGEAKWMPGIIKLVHHLYKHEIPMAVATSSAEGIFDIKMANHTKKLTFFRHVVKGTDPAIKRGKPAPDIYLLAAQRFGDTVKPESCLAFEDSANGILSARGANMQAVMIPDPRVPPRLRREATEVLESAHYFKPESYGLPPFTYRKVTHVIFDLDGLLLNTGKMSVEAIKKILTRYGKTFDPDFSATIIGSRHNESLPRIIKHYGLPCTVKEFTSAYVDLIKDLFPLAEFLPGTEKLLEHLWRSGVPAAVATSSTRKGFESKTTRHREKFAKFFTHVVTGSDPEVKEGKPAPDIFNLAAGRFPSVPSSHADCLVFEDAPNGIIAASRAGMQSVLIPDGNYVEASMTKSATQMLSSMEHFRPEDFGLPPFPK